MRKQGNSKLVSRPKRFTELENCLHLPAYPSITSCLGLETWASRMSSSHTSGSWFYGSQKQPFVLVLQIDVHKNFALCTGKHLCWSLFLIK